MRFLKKKKKKRKISLVKRMNSGLSKHSKKSSKILINSASIEKKEKIKLVSGEVANSYKKARHKSMIDKKGDI